MEWAEVYLCEGMSKRRARVVRLGKVSLAVVLPIDWTRGKEIGAGDEVELDYNGHIEIRAPGAGDPDE